jgi:hypothetical protein
VLFGFLISTIGLPERRRAVLLLDQAHQRAAIQTPYDVVAIMLILTAFIVGVFYCLDALHGERRDRSILFWKSLPVSDLTTLLSKASIPLVVLPLLTFAIIVTAQFIMLLMSSAVLLTSGLASTTWTHVDLFQQSLILFYGLIALALWHAPIYGWALLISGWSRRATFLWAVLPLLAIGIFEKITFNAEAPLDRIRGGGFFLQCARRDRLPDTTHTGKISEHARFLDRAGIRCCICRRSSAATALSRTYLIQLHAQHVFTKERNTCIQLTKLHGSQARCICRWY